MGYIYFPTAMALLGAPHHPAAVDHGSPDLAEENLTYLPSLLSRLAEAPASQLLAIFGPSTRQLGQLFPEAHSKSHHQMGREILTSIVDQVPAVTPLFTSRDDLDRVDIHAIRESGQLPWVIDDNMAFDRIRYIECLTNFTKTTKATGILMGVFLPSRYTQAGTDQTLRHLSDQLGHLGVEVGYCPLHTHLSANMRTIAEALAVGPARWRGPTTIRGGGHPLSA